MIKVCGITNPAQEENLAEIGVDMIGLNFYPPSPRYVRADAFGTKVLSRAGVFVNATYDEILKAAEQYDLDTIQLHGQESPDFCDRLSRDFKIIKAIGIDRKEDLGPISSYPAEILLLLDKKSPQFGGTGVAFDWRLLEYYTYEQPFLLAGGIGPDDADLINAINNERLIGIDLNSRFESSPGIKDIGLLSTFIKALNTDKR